MKPYRETLEPILRHAGDLVLALRKEGLDIEQKEDGSSVTNADKAASDFITAALMAAYPDHGIVSEESDDTSGLRAQRVWVIDPIDGTKHYAQGGELFNIMVALLGDGVEFSMIYYPVLQRWYWAEKGKGSFVRERGQVTQLKLHAPEQPYRIVHAGDCPHKIGEEGSLGVGKYFSKIVHGKKDAFIRVEVPYWDLLPPMLVLLEAGGVVKDFAGNDVVIPRGVVHMPEIVAGNPAVVKHVLSLL